MGRFNSVSESMARHNRVIRSRLVLIAIVTFSLAYAAGSRADCLFEIALNNEALTSQTYQAAQTITTNDVIVPAFEDVIFVAGARIVLGAGTVVEQTGTLSAEINSDVDCCPTDPCDVFAECGCESGEACDIAPNFVDLNICRPFTPSGDETSTCTTASDCAVGYSCLSFDGGVTSSCRELCAGDSDCSTPSGLCFEGSLQAEVGLCTDTCDPLDTTPSGCPSGYGCSISSVPNPTRATTFCLPAGTGTTGQSCSSTSDCAAGFQCVNLGSGLECRQICDTSSPACGVGELCTSFAQVNSVDYGLCAPGP